MRQCRTSIFLISILLFACVTKGQQQDGSVFERRVSISVNNQPLNIIFDQISWQARVFFSYDAAQIDASKRYNLDVIDKSLFFVLTKLVDTSKYDFTELQNQIIISRKKPGSITPIAKTDTVPVRYFFLSGKIIEDRKGDPVSYASVSVLNKPIGTISNVDGDFLLKLHPDHILDTLIISCMGYAQMILPAARVLDEDIFEMKSISIRIREVKVTSTTPEKLLENIRENIPKNYSSYSKLMTAFYRETLKQDKEYVNVSEAVIEILKSPYSNSSKEDLIHLLKGRQSPDFQPFTWLSFKLQGGPFTITKLDVVKNMVPFIDPEYQDLYKYTIAKVIWYNENPVYVLEFQPVSSMGLSNYVGEIYVHRETFAIVHAGFRYNKSGLKQAASILIKRKPAGVKVRPTFVQYEVNYQQFQGKWHLQTARASVIFKIKSKKNNLNSEFHSVSDLLVTDVEPTDLKRFPREESFTQRDIFVEMINNYDAEFWENYNIIKPDEDLRNAFKNFSQNNYPD